MTGLYHILIIAVAVWAGFSGYKKGIFKEVVEVVGVTFGVVAARILGPEFMPVVFGWLPDAMSGFNRQFAAYTLASGSIYVVVYCLMKLVVRPLGILIGRIPAATMASLCGMVFKIFSWLMLLSLAYNLIVDIDPQGSLTKASRQHDGNMVEGVIKIAPAVLGIPDGEEVGYYQQLEDAKKIS